MIQCGIASHDVNPPCCIAKETEQILHFHMCQACASTQSFVSAMIGLHKHSVTLVLHLFNN